MYNVLAENYLANPCDKFRELKGVWCEGGGERGGKRSLMSMLIALSLYLKVLVSSAHLRG